MASLHSRLAGLALATVASLAVAGCNDFLKVENPGAADVGNLADSTNAALLMNGVIGEFQTMYANTAMYGSVLSDESRAAHSNVSYRPIDLRDFTNLNDIDALVYNPIQRTRYAADTVADRFKGYFGANAGKDLRVARMLALAGYGYVMLGETFCQAPVNLSRAYSSEELYQMSLPRFREALTTALAAKAAGAAAAPSDSIANLARVGIARAFMNLANRDSARFYAAQVPASFEFRTYYAEGIPPVSGTPVNPYWNAMGSPDIVKTGNTNISGGFNYNSGSLWVVVGEAFQSVRDPRMPFTPTRVRALDATLQFVANKAASFGGYVRPNTTYPNGVAMTPGASIRVASGIEAQYIAAEASGGDAATLAFVEAQRTANGDTRVYDAATPAGVLAELREQKRREFYLDGHRLGEIRRYKAQYGADFFPSGAYPGSTTDRYGTLECFVIPISEVNSNPNLGG